MSERKKSVGDWVPWYGVAVSAINAGVLFYMHSLPFRCDALAICISGVNPFQAVLGIGAWSFTAVGALSLVRIFRDRSTKIGKVKVLFQRGGEGQKANGTIFFDQLRRFPRMSEHDDRAYAALLAQHFPGVPVAWWPRQSPEAVQAFLRDWCRDQGLELTLVSEYERPSDCYFEWRFDYATPVSHWV
ncbi:hypothetical protein [Burkholderia ubonensis]|uniref:hypothetical protein n=1 Tax=Burkholderia ubonensis TaxID=101571 RepID=UPI0012FCF5A3|nr:hypothetical protein [Burkholderia ubonensis]